MMFGEGPELVLGIAVVATSVVAAVICARFPGAPPHLSGRARTLVDGLLVAGSALLVAWVLGLDQLYADAGTADRLSVPAAIANLAIAAGAVVMLTRARPAARRGLAPVAAGLSAAAAASCGFAYLALGGGNEAVALLYLGWLAGWGLIAYGARRPGKPMAEELEPGLPTQASVFIPSTPVVAAIVASTVAVARGDFDGFLVWNAAAVMILIVARQVLALLENISFWRRLEVSLRERTGELRRSEAQFRSLVQHSSDVIAVIGEDRAIRYLSPSTRRVFGYDPDRFTSEVPLDLFVHEEDLPTVMAAAAEVRGRPGHTVSFECRVRRRDGEWRAVEAVVRNLLEDPAVNGYVVNARDITERKRGQELSHRAFHDPLTDLANRALLSSRLERALARAKRRGSSVAVLFLDLDDFKRVNDSLGHEAGDAILAAVAQRLLDGRRPSDTVARLGGDEFAILIEEADNPGALASVAERVLAALRPPLEVRGRQVVVTGSIGIATSSTAGWTADELLRNADVAMYKAKRDGGGRFEFFQPVMYTALVERLRLEEDLRRAVAEEQFLLHYQPLFWLEDESVFAAEALIRWRHPNGYLLQPAHFVRAAEETGLIVPMGRWVLAAACRQAAEWAGRFPDAGALPVIVNLSASQLHDPHLIDNVAANLWETGLDPSQLVLEITESVVVDGDAMTARLERLSELGVRIAVDDFGSEYASFSYLRRLPVEFLKIDQEFMEGVRPGSRELDLVEAIVGVGQSMRCTAIAEGVESAEQAEALKQIGCEIAQGFYFARPTIPERVGALLAERSLRDLTEGPAPS
jgi:diguanylate cyclase (GGDEF)-like protein/PAS domain S-box-containing protein